MGVVERTPRFVTLNPIGQQASESGSGYSEGGALRMCQA